VQRGRRISAEGVGLPLLRVLLLRTLKNNFLRRGFGGVVSCRRVARRVRAPIEFSSGSVELRLVFCSAPRVEFGRIFVLMVCEPALKLFLRPVGLVAGANFARQKRPTPQHGSYGVAALPRGLGVRRVFVDGKFRHKIRRAIIGRPRRRQAARPGGAP
jgi:hypothetical protein